jgi:hypothetical protein
MRNNGFVSYLLSLISVVNSPNIYESIIEVTSDEKTVFDDEHSLRVNMHVTRELYRNSQEPGFEASIQIRDPCQSRFPIPMIN